MTGNAQILDPYADDSLRDGIAFAITLMEDLVLPTFVLDREGRVIVWNRACERLTGVRAGEVLGTKEHWRAFYDKPRPCLADLVATGDYPAIDRLYTTHDDPRTPAFGVHAENWCTMPRMGHRRYLAVDAGPVFNEAGTLAAVVETLHDITESKINQERIAQQATALKAYFDEHQREAELARSILERQIRADLVERSGIRYVVMPAAQFSGDLVLGSRSPTGVLYALLADATGHGLAAAVSVLPIVQEFYRLVEQNLSLVGLIESINFLLCNSLPPGRFVAATLLRIDQRAGKGEVWIGGLPDVLQVGKTGAVQRRFRSGNLPLGITSDKAAIGSPEPCVWEGDTQLVVVSDGVLEAEDAAGMPFAEENLVHALARIETDPCDRIRAALTVHLAGREAHDDMSVLVVDCPAVA